MSAVGATATSRMVADSVCFQAVVTVTSMADMRRKADVLRGGANDAFGPLLGPWTGHGSVPFRNGRFTLRWLAAETSISP